MYANRLVKRSIPFTEIFILYVHHSAVIEQKADHVLVFYSMKQGRTAPGLSFCPCVNVGPLSKKQPGNIHMARLDGLEKRCRSTLRIDFINIAVLVLTLLRCGYDIAIVSSQINVSAVFQKNFHDLLVTVLGCYV